MVINWVKFLKLLYEVKMGDAVKIYLLLEIIKVFVNNGISSNIISKHQVLSNIYFKQLIDIF